MILSCEITFVEKVFSSYFDTLFPQVGEKFKRVLIDEMDDSRDTKKRLKKDLQNVINKLILLVDCSKNN